MSWVPGYAFRREIVVSQTVGAAANWQICIPLNPFLADMGSIERNGDGWTVNSKSYRYRLPITITETTGGNLSGYQIRVEINTQRLIMSYFLTSTHDGDEFEFVKKSGTDTTTGTCYYWMQHGKCGDTNWNTSETVFWVKSDLTASTEYTFYFYFDPEITASSANHSGANTWNFFDDFEGDALNEATWDYQGTPVISISNSILTITKDSGSQEAIQSDPAVFTTNSMPMNSWRMLARETSDMPDPSQVGMNEPELGASGQDRWSIYRATVLASRYCKIINGSNTFYNPRVYVSAPFLVELTQYNGTGNAYLNNDLHQTVTGLSATEDYRPFIASQTSTAHTVDYICVGQKAASEPLVVVANLSLQTCAIYVVNLDGNCDLFPSGIKVTDEDGNDQPYWLDTATWPYKMWVKIAADLSAADRYIYVYYGTGAGVAVSGDNTMDFFADFEDSDLDDDGTDEGFTVIDGTWTVQSTGLYQEPQCRFTGDGLTVKVGNIWYMFFASGYGTRLQDGPTLQIAISYDNVTYTWVGSFPRFIDPVTGDRFIGRQWGPHTLHYEDGVYYLVWNAFKNLYATTYEGYAVYATNNGSDMIGGWVFQGVLLDKDDDGTGWAEGEGPANGVTPMAPCIKKFGSTYYCYYSQASTGYIWVATANAFVGPYTNEASPIIDEVTYYEGSRVVLDSGVYYMFTGKGALPQYIQYITDDNPLFSSPSGFTGLSYDVAPSWRAGGHTGVYEPVVTESGYEMWVGGIYSWAADAHQGRHLARVTSNSLTGEWTLVQKKTYCVADPGANNREASTQLSVTDAFISVYLKGSETYTRAYIYWRYDTVNGYWYRAYINASSDQLIVDVTNAAGLANVATVDLSFGSQEGNKMTIGQVHRLDIKHAGTSLVIDVNGVQELSTTTDALETAGYVMLGNSAEEAYFKQIFVAKYCVPIPTCIIGTSQSQDSLANAIFFGCNF